MKITPPTVRTLLAILGLFLASSGAFSAKSGLIPPWYLLQTQLRTALEADPCVKVNSLTGEAQDMNIKIMVCNDRKAEALAAFLTKRHQFGEQLAVSVNVYAANLGQVAVQLPSSLEETTKLLSRALHGNKYFVKTGMGTSPMAQSAAYAVFKPRVVQYFADDISDWYQNTNEVAAKVFSDLFNLHPHTEDAVDIFATTAPITSH